MRKVNRNGVFSERKSVNRIIYLRNTATANEELHLRSDNRGINQGTTDAEFRSLLNSIFRRRGFLL
jgi:hypothetical protein